MMMAKFVAPVIQDNLSGWGPCAMPDQFKDMPYQPFSKADRLGKVADWTGATYQDKRYTNKYSSQFGGGSQYAYFHEEDEGSFQLVDTTKMQKTMYQRNRMRFAQRNFRRDKDRRNQLQFNMQTLPKSAKQKERDRLRLQKKFQKQFGVRQKWDQRSQKPRDSSVEVRSDWEVKEEMDFPRLMKMRYVEVSEPQDIECCGALEYYDKAFDRITTRNERPLKSIKRIFHTVTTTDDPVIRKLAKTQGNVFATDAILATLMCCTRSVNSWDIVVQRVGSKVFFDKRDNSDFDLLTVSETANEPPQDEVNSFNSPRNLAMEATYINHNFSQQCLRMSKDKYKFPNPNPFIEDDVDQNEVASVAYRYRRWKLGDDIDLIVRCEHDGVMTGANGEVSFINIKTLNEWDSRHCNGVDWRQKLDSQRGAVIATELKNNSYKLARWTCCALLAGSEYLKLGYVSRYHTKDSSRHVILGTQQFKPNEFASQINLCMENTWGILRCVIDVCMKLDEGKYLILKDPNKQVIRIYSLPEGTFSSDEPDSAAVGPGLPFPGGGSSEQLVPGRPEAAAESGLGLPGTGSSAGLVPGAPLPEATAEPGLGLPLPCSSAGLLRGLPGAEAEVAAGPGFFLPGGCSSAGPGLPGAPGGGSSSPSPGSPGHAPAQRLLFSHDLVSGRYRGALRFGLVRLIHGEDSEEEEQERGSSDSEAWGTEDGPALALRRGYVRVQWYPEGNKQAVKESRLKLEDRSVVPRDMVRRMTSNDSQCGIVIDTNIDCAVKLVGTNCVLYPVNSKDLHHIWPFMYGDNIAFDCWLGKVYNLKTQLILKLSNGARCSMSSDDGSKLYDVCPHVSDSGLFFDDSYGFYPGQVLIGPSKVFSGVQWLSGVKPVLSTKSKFRVVVEEVQVTELKVTWITKSFCLGGAETINAPPSVIYQEDLPRVKRLGCFDHTQRQLGERYLYVFPAKIEPAKVTCECPEKNCFLGERSVTKKVKRLLKKQIVKIISNTLQSTVPIDHSNGETVVPSATDHSPADKAEKQKTSCILEPSSPLAPEDSTVDTTGEKPEQAKDALMESCLGIMQPVTAVKETPLDYTPNYRLQVMDQDADDEAAEDTDTSSVTSSASSTASSQSGGTGRKKSIPLSIKNLKRKHKKKKTKISREFKPGDRVAVEVVTTMTSADVMWQDGTVEKNIRSNDLLPVQHLDNNEFCPGDFVVDKRAQPIQDPGVYGVVQSGDHMGRTCVVKWFVLKPSGDDVELIREEEDVSVYDIADHPDFHFRTTDIVIRIGNAGENEPSVGQVSQVDVSSKVEVVWADDSKTIVLPQHLYNVESEIEETEFDSVEGSSSGASSEWEDESDSWETDYGLTEDDHAKNDEAPPGEATLDENKADEDQGATAGSSSSVEKVDGIPKSFRELKEAIKILESLKNMTVEQLLTGSPTSPTVEPEKPTKEKRFLDDIKKLQENLKKTLDNVAIVEEQKMEVIPEVEKKEEKAETQMPVRSEWPSDTPVLCQRSGGKPGVTFTSAKGEVFSVLEYAPDTHAFKKMEFHPPEAKKFFSTVRKEMALLATSLPDGIMVKTFEDRMDLFSALIKGPTRTPYEDSLFLFDIQLPNIYPAVPPLFRYLSQCSGRLNPNLYDNGKVCVSLLGTWIGKGTERWTSKSSLLQVLISIQGLILVNEPYYNEAGFDSDRGLQEGYENSRCYNEMALIRVVQSMIQLVRRPVDVFEQEIREHFSAGGWRIVHRIEAWLETNDLVEKAHDHDDSSTLSACCGPADSPTDAAPPGELGSNLAMLDGDVVGTETASLDSALDLKDLDDSGCGTSTLAPGDTHQCSDSESTVPGKMVTLATSPMDELKGGLDSSSQPSVKPKKRRKSYRSFLPEKSGYPDIGFPLFPLSKGFMKSIRGVLLQYKSALVEANIPEQGEDK